MTRLFYLLFAGVLAFVPLMVVWSAERPRPVTSGSRTHYYGGHSTVYYGGGRGGWLGSTYGAGHGSADSGGSSSYRGGGPGGGGK